MKIIINYPELPDIATISQIVSKGRTSKKCIIILTSIICVLIVILIRFNGSAYVDKSAYFQYQHNMEYNYGIVIDMGSSGSRVFIYYWPDHDGKTKRLLNIRQLASEDGEPILKKVEPGISIFAKTPHLSYDYLKPLLLFAAVHVPHLKLKETPLYIMATAGLRMLSNSEQVEIMNNLNENIIVHHDFQFDDSHLEVISGKQEGTYQWIAMNYHLKNFEHKNADDKILPDDVSDNVLDIPVSNNPRKSTVGVIDMGGGSVQIAFEVPKDEALPLSLTSEFNLGCSDADSSHHYRIYVSTFLGFGGNIARERYRKLLIRNANMSHSHYNEDKTPSSLNVSMEHHNHIVRDPCLPSDMKESIQFENVPYLLYGTGNYDVCYGKLISLLNKTENCMHSSCSMNGVEIPNVASLSPQFYGFSEYYYTTADILRISGKYNYKYFRLAAMDYCRTKWSVLQGWYDNNFFPYADQNRFKMQCFKSAWIAAVLHEGFNFPTDYDRLTTVLLLNNVEISWTLGALLYKIRFYPLKNMQYPMSNQNTIHSKVNSNIPYSATIVVFCIFIVFAAIIFQLRRLKIVKHTGLHKVPSVVSFLVDPSQSEDGISVRNFKPIIHY